MAKWRIGLWAALVVAAFAFFYAVRGVLLPFVLAYIIAVLLEPLVRKLRLRGFNRAAAVILISLTFFVVVGGLVAIAAPQITNQFDQLSKSVRGMTEQMAKEGKTDSVFLRWNPVARAEPPGPMGFFDKVLEQAKPALESMGIPSSRRALVEQYVTPRRDDIAKAVQSFFSGFVGALAGAASQIMMLTFTPLFAIMIMMDMERLRSKSASWIPPMIRKDILAVLRDIGEVFTSYLRGVATGIACYVLIMSVVLSFMGVPYAILVAFVMGVFYIVPTIGPMINSVLVLLVCGLSGQTGNWFFHVPNSWIYGIIVITVQFFVGFSFDTMVYPRIVGKSVGLNPLVSLFVIFAGGALFGLVGMIIAIPLAGAVKVALDRLIKLTTAPTPDMARLPAVPLRHRHATLE